MSETQTQAQTQTATPPRTCATCANWQPAEGRLYCRIHGAQLCNHDACTAYFRYAPQAEAQADNTLPAASAEGTPTPTTDKE